MVQRLRSTLLLAAVALSVVLLASDYCRAEDDFEALANRAGAARTTGRLDDAVELYRKAIALRPDWREGWWYLGTILYDRRSYDEALEVFEQFVGRWPHHGPAVALKGLCEFQTGEYQRALEDFQQGRIFGLGENPQMLATIRYHAAICLNRLGQFDASYDALRIFAYENQKSPGVVLGLGLSALRMPYLPTQIPPEKEELVKMTGRAAFEAERGARTEADELYRRLIERFPQEPRIHYAYGAFLLRDHTDAALEEFLEELKRSPDDIPALMQLAFEYIRRGEYEKARPFAERATETAPGQFAGHNALGRILLETGDVAGAIRELETAIELAPMAPENRLPLSSAYLKAGRKEDALRERAEYQRLSELKRKADRELEKRSMVPSQDPKR